MLKDYLLEKEEYITTRYKNLFKKNGIITVADLLSEFPTRYDNYTPSNIASVQLDQNTVLEGNVASKVTINYLKNKLSSLNFYLNVDGNVFKAILFNRTFLKAKLEYGALIRVIGKFYKDFKHFTITDLIFCDEINRDIVPNYRIKEIPEPKYFEIIDKTIHRYFDQVDERLPLIYLEKYRLPSFSECLKLMHCPESIEQVNQGLRRLKYEELLQYQVSMKYLHQMRHQQSGPQINNPSELINQLKNTLPFDLTNDQEQAINDIITDLESPYPMNRLLQGEVGSGKTIVAISSILAVVGSGFQAALMCPTEILAKQHLQTIKTILAPFDFIVPGLLTGSTTYKQRKEILAKLKTGEINVIIGTHALFQTDVEYDQLGIVIADEEHRFGVRQRVLIRNKGLEVNYLKMSATPIPRTLSISVYGDMDISIIKQMPLNRKQVITKVVDQKNLKTVITHIKQELKQGHQIYIVTPLIEESETLITSNATEIYQDMVKIFSGIATVGLIHGRLKPNEKEEIMDQFLANQINILVATSVIEVGVNVINATTIVIFGAERFGVATLHQLRGRVMRSDAVPYCFLISNKNSINSDKRLAMLEETTDGFTLAEYDLVSRGPGEFFGERQSGVFGFRYADLPTDEAILIQANLDSDEIMESQKLFTDPQYQELANVAKANYQMKLNQID